MHATCATAAITGYQLDFNLDGNFDASIAAGPTGYGFLFDQPLQPHLGNYGDGTRQVDLRVSTASGLAKTFRLSSPIGNYPPMVSASASVNDATRTVTLSVSATDVGPETIGSISIDWGDGETLTIPGPAGVVSHTYATAEVFRIRAQASDGININYDYDYVSFTDNSATLLDAKPSLQVALTDYRARFMNANPSLVQHMAKESKLEIAIHHK